MLNMGFFTGHPIRGETSGGYRGAAPPMIKKGDFVGQCFGSSYTNRAILKSFIYVALLLLLFAPAKYFVVYGKGTEVKVS